MSYCRWSKHSDVYIYFGGPSEPGQFICWAKHPDPYEVTWPERMLGHMLRHIRHGDKVPRYAVLSMSEEATDAYNKWWDALPEDVSQAKKKKCIDIIVKNAVTKDG